MTVHKIQLTHQAWTYDDTKPLGPPGGFGEVFRGAGTPGDVAIKRLKITAKEAAHRELKIGEHLARKDLSHVVPVLDYGQDPESERYFLVMPVCERSLADELRRVGGPLPQAAVFGIVRQILLGLSEVGEVTHRDLKPANVLRHDGCWKVADFGIAKFVEDSTSLETLRESLTPPYGAPEQWRGERPSTATDVYAVGCIIHAIATGAPPFSGDVAALREKHLHENPKTLGELPSREAAFVAYMLRKAPDARPTLARCIQIFSEAAIRVQQPSPAMSALADAAAKIAERRAQAEAATHAETSRVERRQELNNEANNVLQELRTSLFTRIEGQAVGAKVSKKDVLSLGNAYLAFDLSESRFERNEMNPWDIVTWAQIGVGKGQRWGASLIFARKKPEDDYRWYEVAFFAQPMQPLPLRPASAPPLPSGVVGLDTKDVRTVLARNEQGEVNSVVAGRANLTLKVQLAYGPLPIDAEDQESFFDRWCVLLAKASLNELKQPSVFPINVPLFLGLETR